MLGFRDFNQALRSLHIQSSLPVIAHASLSAFGEVHGGAETVLGALLMNFTTLVMPAFTYKTMVTPEAGPPHNGIQYGSGRDGNRLAELFYPDMPADPTMGVIAEALRRHPRAQRSMHPIQSFSGVNARHILEAQTLKQPLAPIGKLLEGQGWVLLLGVDHTVNTSIHYAEMLAGRKQFVRWAATPQGIQACPGFPGCSEGFQTVAAPLQEVTRTSAAGLSQIRAVPLAELCAAVQAMLAEDPLALLCDDPHCERSAAVRESVENNPA